MKYNSNIKIFIIVLILLVTMTGCNKTSSDKTTEENQKPINVEAKRVKLADSMHEISYSGTIEESESIPLSFPVTGTVERVLVSEGEKVKKGRLLAVLNNENIKNTYEMSLASQKQAEDAYKRLQTMYNNGNLPEIRLVEVETKLQQAKSATAIAKKNLDDCNLFSNSNGFVGKRSIEPGMIAMPNLTSIELIKIEKVYAKISVPENEIALIQKGQKANIHIGALGDRMFTGSIEETGVMADPVSHTYKIKIGIINKGMFIRPGMVCEATIDNKKSVRGYAVPNSAVLVDESGRNYVYVVDASGKTVKRTYVKLGDLLVNGIEIIDGLKKDAVVVVSGQHKLVDNAPVQIINQ